MTIGELKKEMLEIPEEFDSLEIYQAIDEEGNGYFPFGGICVPYYIHKDDEYRPDSIYDGEDLKGMWEEEKDEDDEETFEEYVSNYYIAVAVA